MRKPNGDMRAVLEENQKEKTQKPELEIVESVPEAHKQRSPSRRGKKMVACYLDPDTYRQMKILCAENDTNIESVLKEGLNMVFIANNKPPIQ